MPIVGEEVFTFVEGEGERAMWVACWRRFDVVAQGKTEREAYQSLIRTIAGQAMVDAERGNLTSFGSAPAVPDDLLQRWVRSHAKAHETPLPGSVEASK